MKTVCHSCLHQCSLEPEQVGICRARRNVEGSILCENYGWVTSLAVDPIEKKPLRMFFPGSSILSVGSYGCNLRCPFCQNHQISMAGREAAMTQGAYLPPRELVDRALECRSHGSIGIAFTYNEPLVGWEYVRDSARLAREAGLKTVLVTNGTASPEVLEEVLPFTDAMNIDLKGFTEAYYRKIGGSLEAVKDFIRRAAACCHVELTTLVVPGENDSLQEMEEEARWIGSLKSQGAPGSIPLHITRFFPRYHMTDRSPTDVEQIHRLAQTAERYLDHVYVGNC